MARAAGVSKSLVSLAIRGDAGVGSATREHILSVAHEIGYRSNLWARSLVRGRSQLVGVLLNDLHNTYHTDIVHGIEDAAAEQGLGVIISHGRREATVLAQRLEDVLALGVDGIVVISALLDPQLLRDAARRKPTVVVGRPPALPDTVGGVANHDERGARLAVEHLTSLGHRRIAHLTHSNRAAATARKQSYLDLMTALGYAEGIQVLDSEAGGETELLDSILVRRADAPTAVFASNDRRAASILGGALDAGLRVPEDLSIVGYDNTDLAASVRPGLTSVDQPRLAMGRLAMDILTEMLGGADARHEVVEPTLVVRGSTGRAAGTVN